MKTKASPTSLLLFQQQPTGGVDEGYNGESGDYWWMTWYIFYQKNKIKLGSINAKNIRWQNSLWELIIAT